MRIVVLSPAPLVASALEAPPLPRRCSMSSSGRTTPRPAASRWTRRTTRSSCGPRTTTTRGRPRGCAMASMAATTSRAYLHTHIHTHAHTHPPVRVPYRLCREYTGLVPRPAKFQEKTQTEDNAHCCPRTPTARVPPHTVHVLLLTADVPTPTTRVLKHPSRQQKYFVHTCVRNLFTSASTRRLCGHTHDTPTHVHTRSCTSHPPATTARAPRCARFRSAIERSHTRAAHAPRLPYTRIDPRLRPCALSATPICHSPHTRR